MARYAPPRSRLPRGTNPGDGPGLGAGATCAAFRLLSRYGLHVLAAEVAGVSSGTGAGGAGDGVTETRSSDVFMRRCACVRVCVGGGGGERRGGGNRAAGGGACAWS